MSKKNKIPIKKVMIILEGAEDGDIEIAVDEVRRLIQEGYSSGFDFNDTGAFQFKSSEEDEKSLAW